MLKYKIDEVSSYNAKKGIIYLTEHKKIPLSQLSKERINDLLLDYVNSEHTHKRNSFKKV